MSKRETERVETIVVGGGQAGLSVGYQLARRGLPFLILDANERIGDAWRNRWDSLRLFTPARYDGLTGMRFPGRGDEFPTKDMMADYLESYAKKFDLPVRTGTRVDGLSREGDCFIVTAGAKRFEADNVVVAMANYQTPTVPEFARELDPGITQLHSRDYKNPSQLKEGGVLVVGVGNSGADIAMDVARTHPTWISGKESGAIPPRIESWLYRHVIVRVMRFVGHRVLSLGTPMGRKLRPKLVRGTTPLIRVKPQDFTAAGIERVGRVVGARDGRPILEDQRSLDVTNVIWSTGFTPGFSWIHLPVFDEDGEPLHEHGVVPEIPGLYFVGLHFLYAMTSATVTGVGRDAARIAREVETRSRANRSKTPAPWREPAAHTNGRRPSRELVSSSMLNAALFLRFE
jgi:putative flavoprotein involved in K+ transport